MQQTQSPKAGERTQLTINDLKMASRLLEALQAISMASAKLANIKADAQRYLPEMAVTIDLVSLSEQADGMNEDAAFALGTLEIIASSQDRAALAKAEGRTL